MEVFLLKLKSQILSFDSLNDDSVSQDKESPVSNKKLHEGFHLPITYLEESKKHNLSDIVCSDMELKDSASESDSMYEILFKPSHEFAKAIIPDWSKQITTDVVYLEETQQVLSEMPTYMESIGLKEESFVPSTIVTIWNDIKEDESFMDRYSFMDWEMLKHLNHSSSFLQIMSMVQLFSPVMSLLLPFLFLLVPFFLLKLKGIDISISSYIELLHGITKNHFIGMILTQVRGNFSLEKIVYLVLIIAFYGFNIYQNIRSCIRYYNTITHINKQLLELKKYLQKSVKKMEGFTTMHHEKKSYSNFCIVTQNHSDILQKLLNELTNVEPFSMNVSSTTSFGYWMKCYYRIHSIEEYGKSLQYSFGLKDILII